MSQERLPRLLDVRHEVCRELHLVETLVVADLAVSCAARSYLRRFWGLFQHGNPIHSLVRVHRWMM